MLGVLSTTKEKKKRSRFSIYVQDFGFYGGGVQGSRMSRNIVDPPTPLGSRSMSLRRNGDDQVSPTSEFSPGLLDLHSFDTELLPEVLLSLFSHSVYNFIIFKSFFFFLAKCM